MQLWETGNIENHGFDFGEQGKKAIYFRGTREQVPLWEGPKLRSIKFRCVGSE